MFLAARGQWGPGSLPGQAPGGMGCGAERYGHEVRALLGHQPWGGTRAATVAWQDQRMGREVGTRWLGKARGKSGGVPLRLSHGMVLPHLPSEPLLLPAPFPAPLGQRERGVWGSCSGTGWLGNPSTFCPGAPSLCKKQMGNKQQVGNELPGMSRGMQVLLEGNRGVGPALPGCRGERVSPWCSLGTAGVGVCRVMPAHCHRSHLSLKASQAADRSL